jgi:hypothetical protein
MWQGFQQPQTGDALASSAAAPALVLVAASISSSARPIDLAMQSVASDQQMQKTNLGSEDQLAEYQELTDLYSDYIDGWAMQRACFSHFAFRSFGVTVG